MNTLDRLVRDDSGEELIEYGLLAAFVAAVALAFVVGDPLGLKASVRAMMKSAADALKAAGE